MFSQEKSTIQNGLDLKETDNEFTVRVDGKSEEIKQLLEVEFYGQTAGNSALVLKGQGHRQARPVTNLPRSKFSEFKESLC